MRGRPSAILPNVVERKVPGMRQCPAHFVHFRYDPRELPVERAFPERCIGREAGTAVKGLWLWPTERRRG
jgi:hypothetical protein